MDGTGGAFPLSFYISLQELEAPAVLARHFTDLK